MNQQRDDRFIWLYRESVVLREMGDSEGRVLPSKKWAVSLVLPLKLQQGEVVG